MNHSLLKTISLFAASAMLAACSTTPNGNPEGIILNLDITGLPENTQVTISPAATQQPEDPIQTVTVVNGKAQFAFDVEGPRIYDIMATDSYGLMQVVMDKGQVATLSAKATGKSEDGKKVSYTYENQQVSGQSLQEEFIRRRVNRDALNERYDAMFQLKDKEEFNKAQAQFFHDVDSTYKAAFKASSDSWWGPMLILNSYTYISTEQEDDYNMLSEAAKESHYGKILHDKIWPPSVVGNEVPDFEFTDYATGQRTSLYKSLEGKKYLLLDFWASWCQPCHKEIPNLKAIYEKYHARGLDIVGISADHNEEDWRSTLEEMKEPWCNYLDINRQAITEYKVQYIPSIFIIDAQGNIIAEKLRGKELADYIDRLFAE